MINVRQRRLRAAISGPSQSRDRHVYREWLASIQLATVTPCEPTLVLLACPSAHHLLLTYPLKSIQKSVPFPNASLSTTYPNLLNARARPHLARLQPLNSSLRLSPDTRAKKIARPRVSPNSTLPSTLPYYAHVLSATLPTPRARQRMRLCIIPTAQGFRGVCNGAVMKKGQHLRHRSPRSLPA